MKKATDSKLLVVFILVLALSVLSACGASVSGTYSNASGMIVLELKSGGKATLSMMGEVAECTYETEDKQIALTCKDEKMTLARNQDGSLTGPGFIGLLQKSKS